MVEGEDPLEGGLEIVAKPPGKKPATLSLLSGGEQSLTALALIFAVFLTNPSPICVLDEVDAPLDDANVDRFCTLMEKMAADTATRFLVITHHPMTMTRMNRLFGVTMGEKGVSQLVSVDLETAQRFTARRLEACAADLAALDQVHGDVPACVHDPQNNNDVLIQVAVVDQRDTDRPWLSGCPRQARGVVSRCRETARGGPCAASKPSTYRSATAGRSLQPKIGKYAC